MTSSLLKEVLAVSFHFGIRNAVVEVEGDYQLELHENSVFALQVPADSHVSVRLPTAEQIIIIPEALLESAIRDGAVNTLDSDVSGTNGAKVGLIKSTHPDVKVWVK